MYLQTFNNSFLKYVFISDLTSVDTDSNVVHIPENRMTLRDSMKRLQDGMHKRPPQDDSLDVESRLSLPVVK